MPMPMWRFDVRSTRAGRERTMDGSDLRFRLRQVSLTVNHMRPRGPSFSGKYVSVT
jgi:hypothetical protein